MRKINTFYNEFDAYPAQWMRNLIKAGQITPGHVDERSIEDVRPDEIVGFTRAHFFAGIGGWDLALRLAGWPLDREVWTGSCPCQPFSQAGKGKGVEDERHLWPVFYRLIEKCRPAVVFGEQVASKAGRLWLTGVRADLEALGYAFGASDLCAASLNAPHIRQRLWWVAYAEHERPRQAQSNATPPDRERVGAELFNRGCFDASSRLEHPDSPEPQQGREASETSGHGSSPVSAGSGVDKPYSNGYSGQKEASQALQDRNGEDNRLSIRASSWDDFIWAPCLDGKARRLEPGLAPLAHGVPARVGKIRAYGNAIVPQVAAEFIKAFMESQ